MAALYVHIPFCVKKCAYCDFASYPERTRDMARYLSALFGEADAAREEYGQLALDTVFIGGGTPSLLSAEEIARLMEGIGERFSILPGAEITMEANPGTVDSTKLRAMRDAGINRVSFGVQAMQPALLALLGRIHRWEDAERAIHDARQAGFDNLSIDLIYAIPGQTMEDWEQTLSAALALDVPHISCYSLILEEGTPLARQVSQGQYAMPSEDLGIDMQEKALEMLRAHGYDRYEISNYARPGFECRHNTVYWTRGSYLGLGCAAHSLMRGERFENPASLDAYLSGERGIHRVRLSREEEREEAIMLETRRTKGLNLARYAERYEEDFLAGRRARVDRLVKGGLVHLSPTHLSLTTKGLQVHNAIVLELL